MRLAAIVVTYNPDIDTVISNISTYAKWVDLLILWNNSENGNNKWTKLTETYPDVVICQNYVNIGLPNAYNEGVAIARQNGCTHLMTMDQDSSFVSFDQYRRGMDDIVEANVGIISCPINGIYEDKNENGDVYWANQSGSVFSIAMLENIGLFRGDFFIDMVETEICLRCVAKGYRIVQLDCCNLIHNLGYIRNIKFIGKKIKTPDYSAMRQYYQTRNRILIWHSYPYYELGRRARCGFFKERFVTMGKILLFEHNKIQKVLAILRGIFWGTRNIAKSY